MFSETDVAAVRHIVQRILVPCVFVIGLLGNCVSIYVLTRKRMRCTTNIYLTALAITDIIYLTLLVILSLKHYDYIVQNCEAFYKLYGIFHWLIDACAYISIYIAVCFTIERFIAIRYPLKRQKFCTESLAKKVIAGVALFCLFSTISTAFEHSYIIEWKLIDGDGRPCDLTVANSSPAPPTFRNLTMHPSNLTLNAHPNASLVATEDADTGHALGVTSLHFHHQQQPQKYQEKEDKDEEELTQIVNFANLATVRAPVDDDDPAWSSGSGYGALAINVDMLAKRHLMTLREKRHTQKSMLIGSLYATSTRGPSIDDSASVGVGVGVGTDSLVMTTQATRWPGNNGAADNIFDSGVDSADGTAAEDPLAAWSELPTLHQVAEIPSIMTATQPSDNKKQLQFHLPATNGHTTVLPTATGAPTATDMAWAITQPMEQHSQGEREEAGLEQEEQQQQQQQQQQRQEWSPITAFEAVEMTTPTRLTQLQRRYIEHGKSTKATDDSDVDDDDDGNEKHNAIVDDHNNMAQAEQLPWPLSLQPQPTQPTQPSEPQLQSDTETETETETGTDTGRATGAEAETETETGMKEAMPHSGVNAAMAATVSTVPTFDSNTFAFNITEYCQNVTVYRTVFSDFGINELYNRIWSWYSLLVFVLIPLSILATFNCFLIMLVRRSKSLRGNLTNASSMRRFKRKSNTGISSVSQENRVTVTLIAVVLLFIVCQLPWAIYIIISLNMKIDNNLQAIIGNISNFLAAINAAANFFLYCVLSDKYRKTVREMITGYRLRHRHAHTNASLYATSSTYVNGSRRFRNSTSMTILALTPSPVELPKTATAGKLIT